MRVDECVPRGSVVLHVEVEVGVEGLPRSRRYIKLTGTARRDTCLARRRGQTRGMVTGRRGTDYSGLTRISGHGTCLGSVLVMGAWIHIVPARAREHRDIRA
jgi:hypothetical protein